MVFTLQEAPLIFDRLTIEPAAWCKLVSELASSSFQVPGHPQTVDSTRTRLGKPTVPSPENNARTAAVELDALFHSFSMPACARRLR